MPVEAAAAAASGGDDAAAIRARIRADRLAKEKAQRKRVADLEKPDGGMMHRADMGHGTAIARGLVEVRKDDHLSEDPNQADSRQYRGARAVKVWAPERLSRGRNPAISPEGLQAAQKLLDVYLIGEMGARAGADASGVRLDPWARLPYSERRAMARQSYAFAMKAVGIRMSGVVVWCVLQQTPGPDVPPTADAYAKSIGWGTERAVGWLAAALELLAVHFGYAKASPATIAPGRREGDGS